MQKRQAAAGLGMSSASVLIEACMCAIPAPWCPSLSSGAGDAAQVKQAVLLSATEAAEMVLRVDEIIKCAVGMLAML